MTIDALNTAYASNTDVIVKAMRAECSSWPSDIYICSGFIDESRKLEDGTPVTFQGLDFDFLLPKRGRNGLQGMSFEFDKYTLDAGKRISQAIDDKTAVKLTIYEYAGSLQDPSFSLQMYAKSSDSEIMGDTNIKILAAFDKNLINKQFPILRYTIENTPGLRN